MSSIKLSDQVNLLHIFVYIPRNTPIARFHDQRAVLLVQDGENLGGLFLLLI